MLFKIIDNILLFENIIEKEEEKEKDSNGDLRQLIKIFCYQKSFPDIETKKYNNESIQIYKVF